MGGRRINDRQMKQAMKKMGLKQEPVPGVVEVIIRTKDKDIVIRNADVICVEMGGSKSYQVSGPEVVMEHGEDGVPVEVVTFPDEDIEIVMSQTGCDRDKAIEALKAADGQPAEAIMKIMTERYPCAWQFPGR